nr:hypothetical protein [Helicobacter pylori]
MNFVVLGAILVLKIIAKKSLFTNKKSVSIYSDPKKAQKTTNAI